MNGAADLCNASNHVGDETFDCSQASYMLPAALPHCEGDFCGLALDEPNVHVDMADVLGQCSPGPFDSDKAGLDGDVNSLGDVEFFCLEYVPHLEDKGSQHKVIQAPSLASNTKFCRNRAITVSREC